MRQAWIAALLFSCSSSDLPPPEVSLYVGHEQDNWSVFPEAKHLRVDLVQTNGSRSLLLKTAAPPSSMLNDTTPPTILTLPEEHFNQIVTASLEATATDALGDAVVRGITVPLQFTALQAVRIPVFLGRVGQFSRPPEALDTLHVHPAVVSLGNEYVFAAGGDSVVGFDGAVPDIYDVAIWRPFHGQPPLPRAPKSMAFVVVRPAPDVASVPALFLVDGGGATWLNLSNDAASSVTSPGGLDFSEIAGGDAFTLPDHSVYVVGATRPSGAPTDKVLRIDGGNNAQFTVLTLGTPRLGAGASVVGSTLVIAGGTNAGPMAEVLTTSQTSFTPLPFAVDATAGLGLAARDATTAVAAGGKDPVTGTGSGVRALDTTCAADCTTLELATLPIALDRTKVFVIDDNRILVMGESEDGQNRAFLVDTTDAAPSVDEKLLREPRKGATPVLLPNGQVGIVGGQLVDTAAPALTLEVFIP